MFYVHVENAWILTYQLIMVEESIIEGITDESPKIDQSCVQNNGTSELVDLPEPIEILTYHNPLRDHPTRYYILGTAHLSSQSASDADRLIRQVNPNTLLLELCEARQSLLSINKHQLKHSHSTSLSQTLQKVKNGTLNPFAAVLSAAYHYIGNSQDALPGEEFRAAVQAAKDIDATIVLGDRPLHITVTRTWRLLSSWQKICLLSSLMFGSLYALIRPRTFFKNMEELKTDDDMMVTFMEQLGASYPTIIQTLVLERDLFMISMLRELSEQADTVVGVVGAGHLEGIKAHWADDEIDVDALMQIPGSDNGDRNRNKEKNGRWRRAVEWSVLVAGALTGVAVVVMQRTVRKVMMCTIFIV
jgi:pheromone shutdown protein TraB